MAEPGAASSGDRSRRLRYLLLTLVVAVYLLHALHVSGWIKDDAYISYRYARNLVAGHGLVFNPGEHVEGYTNLSWVLLAALSLAAGLDPTTTLPVVGAASGVGLILLVASGGRRIARRRGAPHPLAGLVAAGLMAATPSLAFYAVCGLETALAALLMTAGGLALVQERPRVFAVMTALAFATRPEAALLGVVGCCLLGIDAVRGLTGARARWARALCWLTVGIAPQLLFKVLYFGSVLPNTVAAKPPSVMTGVEYVAAGVLPLGGVVLAAAVGCWSARRRRAESNDGLGADAATPTCRLLLLWGVMQGGVVLEGGDFMPVYRMILPSLAILAVAADRTIVGWLHRAWSARDWRGRLRWLPVAAVAAYLPHCWVETDAVAYKGRVMSAVDEERTREAQRIAKLGIRSLGTYDVGLIGYLLPTVTITDLGGLTDLTIGASPGAYFSKRTPIDYLRRRAPEAFLFTSRWPPHFDGRGVGVPGHYLPEQYVMADPWFASHYRYHHTAKVGTHYYLNLFVSRDIEALSVLERGDSTAAAA